MAEKLEKSILKISELVQLEKLTIPPYQRPYKWTEFNINQLFNDIARHSNKQAYRLGTIVFHKDNDSNLNIVDGQQRTLTLVLIFKALINQKLNQIKNKKLTDQITNLKDSIENFIDTQCFDSDISQINLHENYQTIKRLVAHIDFDENQIDFLLNRCEVVTFTLVNIAEAFQFFDSQNARGRDLEPHDLLKAYHLREFNENEQKESTVAKWESIPSKQLANLFAFYLYRIRRWVLMSSARHFGKDEIKIFKGVNIEKMTAFPFVKSLKINHYFVDNYNKQSQRNIDNQHMEFPFSLDQMIINGRRFFEMIVHYQKQLNKIKNENSSLNFMGVELSETAKNIFKLLNSYDNRYRTGDQYVRAMFDCVLLFYIDKFGSAELSKAIEKIFIWSYQLRIKQYAVYIESIDNHVLKQNPFRLIKEAILPSDFLSIKLPLLKISDVSGSKQKNINNDELVKQFKVMNYYE